MAIKDNLETKAYSSQLNLDHNLITLLANG